MLGSKITGYIKFFDESIRKQAIINGYRPAFLIGNKYFTGSIYEIETNQILPGKESHVKVQFISHLDIKEADTIPFFEPPHIIGELRVTKVICR